MAKTSKGVILSQASQIKSDYSFALIKATADNKSLVQDASSAELKVNALVEYSKDSQWDPKKLTNLGFPAGCFLIVDLRGQDIHAADLITNLALVRQYGYQAGVIDDLSTLDDIKALKANQIYLINSGKANDDQDASLNGDEITDGSGKLAVGMSVKWQRDYTNVDVSGDHAGFVGMGQDTLLKGGNAFGYSTNGRDFNAVITPKGLIFRRPDAERMWRLLKPNEIADINSTVGDKVKKEVDSATAEIPAAVSAANSAVSAAESAIAASKVNSDAIVAQSEAISEAKSAMDSATAEIQQTAANAASDAAKIRADVAQVQNEVDTAKAANSASVDALKSDINTAKQDLANVHDSLTKARSAIEQNQKLINDSVAKITSDVSATKQDLADVHDSLTKAQAAAEQNQKAINDSIAQINANVDATNQDLAGVRKDLTKAQSDITANQKAVNDNVAQINADITQDRKDIADVRQGLTKAQSDITANQKAVNDNVAQINSNIEQDRKDIASAQQANADTAKQLDTYSKEAQEQGKTIKSIQDKQDGFSIALADVQGNVAQVSDKVDGLSANLKDAQGNVASVKAQADQLSATLTDHGKAIATLTASAKELSSTLEDADGRLSKVEQTAQTNSSTLSDVQGDLSQVKQNATKLVSTLKDAQGNISTLQQKADSVSTQLASAQGDIATLQTGVDSVKATLTSHDKSIHTLQADSKSLKDSMADAQGDISTLSKTATDVTSELEDHTGRLSKVEQSAAKQATTLSDLQGNLSQVEQKADSNTATISSINKNAMQDRGVITDTKTSFDSLTQLGTYSIKASDLPKMPEQHYGTLVVSGSAGSGWLSQQFVADTTGNVYTRVFSNNAWSAWKQGGSQDAINQVKQTADSNSATIRNVQGDVSTLKQTAAGVEAALADHEGDIHTLQADDKSLKDSMADAQGDISTLSKTATSLDSEMKDHAGRLSKVEQSATAQATTLSDLQGNLSQVKQQADGLVTTLKSAQGDITQIQQKADGTLEQLKSAQGDIASLQTDVTGIKATLTSHEGDIHTLQADSKTLRDDMTDAQGNISSLKKSATDLTSEMSSQDGRLSKVEQTAKEHTSTISDLGDKLSNMKVGGRNLATGTAEPYTMGFGIPNTTWKDGYAYEPLPTKILTNEILPQDPHTFYYSLTPGQEYTQTVWLETDATVKDLSVAQITWFTNARHDYQPATLIKLGENKYKLYSTYTWPDKSDNNVRLFDTCNLDGAFNLSTGTYLKFGKLKLETGNTSTDWTPAPEDLATVTQVKQTADGIEMTLKSAQGDIDQIKQTAKGTSEQLSNAQGDITALQKDVSGIKLTIADHDKNIHTLQADSKTLKDDMADAKGNISSLQKTSTSLVSEFKDHDGRLSKVEQTATEHTSELTDTKGNIDKVTQKANALQLLLSDAQKNIQNIQLDAKGLHDTLTGQSNQLASLNVTLNSLDSKYSGITGDLQSKQTALSTEQQQTKDMLLNKADKSEVDSVKGTVNQVSAEQKLMADQISSKVSAAEYQKDKTDTITAIQKNSTAIDETNKLVSIKANQTDVDNVKGTAQRLSARLDVMAGEVKSKVDETRVNNIVDSKGYATTSTVQSLITQKAGTINESITNLDAKINEKDGVNLLTGTADFTGNWFRRDDTSWTDDNWRDTNGNRVRKRSGSAWNGLGQTVHLEPGNYTFSLDMYLNLGNGDSLNIYAGDTQYNGTANIVQLIDGNRYDHNSPQGSWFRAVCHFKVTKAGNVAIRPELNQGSGTVHVGSYKLEKGLIATPWTPAPSDNATVTQLQSVTASIDGLQSNVTNFKNDTSSRITQLSNMIQSKVSASDFNDLKDKTTWKSTDNIDLNSAVSQQKIFVTGGSNLPPGDYWWYVQVEPGYDSRIVQYAVSDRDNIHYSRQYDGSKWSAWSQGATESEITQLRDDINLRVKSGDLLSQINLTAGNTLIQSNKLYLDASSVVITGTAFIPSAAIANLSADKINTGCLNTNDVSLGDGRTRIRADHDYMYIQPTGSAASNTGIRMGYSGLDFLTNVIPNGYNSSVPYYSIGYDGAANGYFKISAFDHINPGEATATQNWFSMVDAISLTNSEINFATKGNMHMQVVNGGVNIKPTLFFQNNTNNGTWAGFTRADNSNIVEFSSGDNNGENFRIDCGARFMQYVYINGNARAQQWLTNSTLSKKTNIRKLDQQIALDKIRQDDQYLYEYKRNIEQGIYDPQASFIIDDVNDVSHYSVPREFIDQSGNYREPNVELAYLIAAFQAIDKQVQKQKEEIKELKEKLQHE